jgi:heterotetrameric sarcosine oxidase gamma subunit
VADMSSEHSDRSEGTGRGVTLTKRTDFETAQVWAWPETSAAVVRILTEALGVRPPEEPNVVASERRIKILWLGPDRWLIVRQVDHPRGLASELIAQLPAGTAALVDLGAARCVFTISGPRSRDVLAKHLPLDLSESMFPTGRCAQSAMAHIGVLVHAESADTFEIFVYRSFAQHLWQLLTDAAWEFCLDAPP